MKRRDAVLTYILTTIVCLVAARAIHGVGLPPPPEWYTDDVEGGMLTTGQPCCGIRSIVEDVQAELPPGWLARSNWDDLNDRSVFYTTFWFVGDFGFPMFSMGSRFDGHEVRVHIGDASPLAGCTPEEFAISPYFCPEFDGAGQGPYPGVLNGLEEFAAYPRLAIPWRHGHGEAAYAATLPVTIERNTLFKIPGLGGAAPIRYASSSGNVTIASQGYGGWVSHNGMWNGIVAATTDDSPFGYPQKLVVQVGSSTQDPGHNVPGHVMRIQWHNGVEWQTALFDDVLTETQNFPLVRLDVDDPLGIEAWAIDCAPKRCDWRLDEVIYAPEPNKLILLLAGLAMLAVLVRHKQGV